MGDTSNLPDSLESVAKEHEKDVVIELGTDRLIRWLGVYAILFLAVVTKINDIVDQNVSCFPVTPPKGNTKGLIAYVNIYCWENEVTDVSLPVLLNNTTKILENPNNVKSFIRWLPFVMLGQSIIFTLPSAFWHFRVGARLTGHLKFMQLLLKYIYKELKFIENGMYFQIAYDESSSMLDGRIKYDKIRKEMLNAKKQSKKQTFPNTTEEEMTLGEVPILQSKQQPTCSSNYSENLTSCVSSMQSCYSCWETFLAGDMRDINFFSMLCYENFASLHHLPYILSVFKLLSYNKDNDDSDEYKQGPILEMMLRLWCDKKNFNKIFLLKMYAYKQLSTAAAAMLMIINLLTWFFQVVYDDLVYSENFGCYIPVSEIWAICTIRRVKDARILFLIEVCSILGVLVFSLYKWIDVRSSRAKNSSHYFDILMATTNAAFLASQTQKKKNAKNS